VKRAKNLVDTSFFTQDDFAAGRLQTSCDRIAARDNLRASVAEECSGMRGENVEIKEQIPQNENVHCDHIGCRGHADLHIRYVFL
jgi:hypothetical protein